MALWPASDGALDRIGRAAARGCSQQHGRQHGGGGQQSFVALVDELAHEMPLRDVRGFVRQHARQFILVARRRDQSAVEWPRIRRGSRRR